MDNTMYGKTGELSVWLRGARRLHMIGILGAGMRPLARMAHDLGYTVTGSDDRATEGMSLEEGAIPVSPPSADGAIIDAELAVYSTAVTKDHPEVAAATARGIPLVSRADLFGELMRAYPTRIGVAGTHGKSTTTAMCGALLAAGGLHPTLTVGAPLAGESDGYRHGGGEALVFEACEYGRAFLSFAPTVAVLTNAAWDHPDCFRTPGEALEAFGAYLSLPSVEAAVINFDDPGARRAAATLSVPVITFGLGEEADVRATGLAVGEGGCVSFTLLDRGKALGRVTLAIPGRHNVENALAAAAAARVAGVPEEAIVRGLSSFAGVGRRTQYRGTVDGVRYYDDYAHHPTEIEASLAAVRGHGRLFCVYQPHTYSRTAGFFDEFCRALSLADRVIVTETYAARESEEAGVGSRALAAGIGRGAVYLPTPEVAALWLRGHLAPGDTVIVMGAGDVAERFFGRGSPLACPKE